MTKIISIFLIVTMLLSMIVLPTFSAAAVENAQSSVVNGITLNDVAANAGTDMSKWPEQPGSMAITDPTYSNVGNTVVSKTDTKYKEDLAAAGYIPIVASKGEGKPENAILFTEINSNAGNYYLYEDITVSAYEGKPNGLVLDGCGHTISVTHSLFDNPTNVTLKNITFTGKIDCITIYNGGGFSILGCWGYSGWLKAYNITIDVDVVTNNQSNYQWGGILATCINTGSVIENVLNTGDFTFKGRTDGGETKIQSIGGIVGKANEVKFKNVVNKGNIIIGDGTTALSLIVADKEKTVVGGIGGIAGWSEYASTYENCFNEGNITIADKAAIALDAYVGGLVGKLSTSTTFKNCLNKGNISISADTNTATKALVGGIVGTSTAFVSFENVVNKGNISSAKSISTGDPVGSIGGIIGYFSAGANFYKCKNDGNLSNTVDKYNIGGIAGWGEGAKAFSHCINNGKINIYWSSANQAGAAGMCGFSKSGTVEIYHCENNGAITLSGGNGGSLYTGGLLGRQHSAKVTVTYCKNTGAISGTKAANGANPTGGIVAGAQHGTWAGNPGYTVSYCYNNAPVSGRQAGGIFGGVATDGANVAVLDVVISHCINGPLGAISGHETGGIVGAPSSHNHSGSGAKYDIDYCTNQGRITSDDCSGGIGGWMSAEYDIDNCLNEGTVSANDAGGMVGNVTSGVVSDISGCKNTAAINGKRSGAGIVGYTKGTSTTISNCANLGEVTGGNYAGGIVAKTETEISISGSKNSANVSGKMETGGILGHSTAKTTVSNCENAGETVKDIASADAVGDVAGIVGCVEGELRISNVTNRANIENRKIGGTAISKFVGGIVARVAGTVYINSNDDGTPINGSVIVNHGAIATATAASGNTQYVGGIIGFVNGVGYVANATNEATATLTAYENGQGGCSSLGGIVGVPADSAKAITVTNCHNKANISSNGYNNYSCGGIIGRIFSSVSTSAVTVKNCSNSGSVTAYKCAGGIVGFAEGGAVSVYNCSNSGAVNATTLYAGGILGYALKDCYFEGCVNTGNVTARQTAGGILGAAGRNKLSNDEPIVVVNATFKNCVNGESGTNKAKIENTDSDGSNHATGGVAGYVQGDFVCEGVVNYGEVTSAAATEKAAKYMGGILGISRGKIYAGYTIASAKTDNKVQGAKCYNYGKITVNGIFNHDHVNPIGGLFGHVINGGFITNCENVGDIEIKGTRYPEKDNQGGVGGIVGAPADSANDTTITNCINRGKIYNSTGSTVNWYAGGIVGSLWDKAQNVTITNCYNYGTIENFWIAGGIVGRTYAPVTLTVSDCANNGAITNSINHEIQYTGKYAHNSDSSKNGTTYKKVETSYGGIVALSNGVVNFTGCVNNGKIEISAVADTAGYVGGIVGRTLKNADFTNCQNNVAVSATAERYHIGGIAGCLQDGTHNITNTVNKGVVTAYKHTGGTMQGIGGIIGYANGGTETITYTVNEGAVILNGAGKDTRVGGIVGRVANQCVLTLNYVMNDADVTAAEATETGNHVGGIIGNIQTWNQTTNNYKVDINNTVNNGDVTGYVAAGFVGLGYPDADNGGYNVRVDISNAINNGKITGKEIAAGFVGGANRSEFTVNIDTAANAGAVSGKYAGGITARSSGMTATLNTVVNIGAISGTNAYGLGANVISSNCATVDADTTVVEALSVLDNCGLVAFDLTAIDAAIARAQNIVDTKKKSEYVEDTWNLMAEKLEAAKAFYGEKLEDFDPKHGLVIGNGTATKLLTQAEINIYTEALVEATAGLWRINELVLKVQAMLDEAQIIEKDYYDGKVIYTPETWVDFMNAIGGLRIAVTYGEALSWEMAEPAMAAMTAATNGLVKGGTIYTVEEFYALSGVEGEFYLAADITITKPLAELKADIYGEGHTITLDGCAIAQTVNGANIENLKVEGAAGEADSLLGSVSGNVEVSGMIIKVDSFAKASLFDTVANSADVVVYDVITYADAPYFVSGVKGDVEIAGVLAMGQTEALADNSANVEAETTYVNGVAFYNEKGKEIVDPAVFASGEVTVAMNANFNTYADNYSFSEFSGIVLTQKLDGNSLPSADKVSIDGTNVVVSDGKGGFVNEAKPLTPPVISTPEEEAPVELDFTALNTALEAAKKLDQTKYTEASWLVLQTYVNAAEAALKAVEQIYVDVAAEALSAATAALEENTATEEEPAEQLDFSKLDEAIAKAEALKAENYSEGTWAALQTMLALGKAAKLSAMTQSRIDQAVSGIDTAIAGLKAPIVKDEPVVDNNDNTTKDEATDDGCGGVVGGAAVIALAVLALGAGVTFKKKED